MPLDYSIIGKRIREERLKKGLRQEDLAEKIDVSDAFMSRIENGSSKINLKRLTQLAEILEISPGLLITGSNDDSKNYLKYDMNRVLERCTPEQQKLIFEIAELVSKSNF